MSKYVFCIVGNQENKAGNPIPYHRTTRNSFWDAKSKRYKAWKDFACQCAVQQLGIVTASTIEEALKWKPFTTTGDGRRRMDIMVTFSDKKHGDADNIFKGLADALFVQDKWLSGSFAFKYGKVGAIHVTIEDV